MKITDLKLIFFKNHKNLHWEIYEDVVAICAKNGAGKTNVLDAIHCLCLGKSYFNALDSALISTDENASTLKSVFEAANPIEVKISLSRGKKKRIEKNGKPYVRIADHVGNFLCVMIAPRDVELIFGANEPRRNFVDQLICQYDTSYLNDLMKYQKLILHRNNTLKADKIDATLIAAIDAQIEKYVYPLYEARRSFFELFTPVVNDFYNILSADKEIVDLTYSSQLENATYKDLTYSYRHKDQVLQRSNSGIHKDEIIFLIENQPLKVYGSQGQIKSALIALKLAAYQLLQSKTGKNPLLLLDDIFEKIDNFRAEKLTEIIKKNNFGQIFITDTHIERISQFCEQIGKPYTIKQL